MRGIGLSLQWRAKLWHNGNSRTRRRGLSTVVGGVFMIIIMAGAINATLWTMQQQDRVTETIIEKTNSQLGALNEKIEISEIRVDNNRFNLTVSNTGGSTAELGAIYIVNETALPREQYRYDLDVAISGGESISNIGQSISLVASNSTGYSVKVVTKTGNSAAAEFSSLSATPLQLTLYVIPPSVTTGENATLLYSITNNGTNSKMPLVISPTINSSMSCLASSECLLTRVLTGPSEVEIQKGSTALIKEVYEVIAPVNTRVTFNASFAGALTGNYVTETATVIEVEDATAAAADVGSIAISPDIYMVLPGPFGDSNQRGLWGVVLVNPTSITMNVSRVVMTAYTAQHSGDTEMVSYLCSTTAIYPTTASEWGCPHDNQIQWKDLSTPESLLPGDSKSFLVRVQPTDISENLEEAAAAVIATVYTDFGVFMKSGYSAAMTENSNSLGNVYLSDTNDASLALGNTHIFAHRNNIAPGSNQTFDIVLADLDSDVNTYINAGGKLIINVPEQFQNVTILSHTGFSTPSIQTRADGFTQIIGTTTGNTGDSASGEAKIIRFRAAAPSPVGNTTYLMYVSNHGTSNSSPASSAGAIAEMAIQVNGTG
jgi:hypothetical protein